MMEENLEVCEAFFAEGKIDEAEACFLNLLNSSQPNAEILNNLGVICHSRGRFEESEDYFLRALSVQADHLDSLINLADLYQNAARWNEAAVQLEKCVIICGRDHHVLNRLARVYLELGDADRARKVLKKSLELNPAQEAIEESLSALENRHTSVPYLPEPNSYRVAFTEIDITPPVSEDSPVFLQGMDGMPRKATRISTPLRMQLLLLEDDHFTKVLFVAADLFGFGTEMVEQIRNSAAPWGIGHEAIILNASHTHYAPGTLSRAARQLGPFYQEYAREITQSICRQIPLLYGALEACKIYAGKTDAQVGICRRFKKDGRVLLAPNSEGAYQTHTPFLVFHLLDSNTKVLMVSHSCHPTGLGNENEVSADYPAYMREALATSGSVTSVMFLQGAAGNTKEAVNTEGKVQFCFSSDGARINGETLAQEINKALKKELRPVEGPAFCALKRAILPLKARSPDDLRRLLKSYPNAEPLVREGTDQRLSHFPEGGYPDGLPLEVQVISLGETVLFVTFPGEPVAPLAKEVTSLIAKPEGSFVLGYTNGLVGYLLTDEMIEEGGYEADLSHFAYLAPSAFDVGSQSAIISAVSDGIKSLNDLKWPKGFGNCDLPQTSKSAFFVLSAGRCGTMTLAHLLDTATNARVWHHPKPDLLEEALLAYWGEIDREKAFWKARYAILHKTWSEHLVYGETDLLMTPFCDMLAHGIPDSRYLVLVRDPRDFVRSGMRRKYYRGHPWDPCRLRPRQGTKHFEWWKELDDFEKICWLWAKTYEYINASIEKIGQEKMMVVRFEDLVAGVGKTKEIFDFLGLEGFREQEVQEILNLKLNAQVEGSFPQPSDWSPQFNETLWNLCGPAAELFGYSRDYDRNSPKDRQPRDACTSVSSPTCMVGTGPEVSVGLYVYNGEPLLGEAIESVLSQDFEDLELIVSDNGSTDATRDICAQYMRMDRRVSYHRFEQNLGELRNFLHAFELSRAPYFMWASDDDLREKSFIKKCLHPMKQDPSIALVYPRTRLVDRDSKDLGIGRDHVRADQEDPVERFWHVIWQLAMCNAFYGIYSTDVLRKTRSLYKHLYRGYDNLLLAEMALRGKIVQIEDILYVRRLTRNYSVPLDEHNADLINSYDPIRLSEGITLPYCRLTYAHLELINESTLPLAAKNLLFPEILRCFKARFGSRMLFEINRAIHLIRNNLFFYTWDKKTKNNPLSGILEPFDFFHVNNLLKNLQEAAFIYPELPDIKSAMETCRERMRHHQISGGEQPVQEAKRSGSGALLPPDGESSSAATKALEP